MLVCWCIAQHQPSSAVCLTHTVVLRTVSGSRSPMFRSPIARLPVASRISTIALEEKSRRIEELRMELGTWELKGLHLSLELKGTTYGDSV